MLSRYHGQAPDEINWAEPERQTRAVKEYLARLEADVQPNPDRKPPKVISPSDPCSAWTAKANKRVQLDTASITSSILRTRSSSMSSRRRHGPTMR